MIRIATSSLTIALLAFGVAGLGPRLAHADEVFKIGYVDMQRALLEIEDGRRAREELEKDKSNRQKELNERQAAVQKSGEDLQKKRSLLTPEAVAKKEAELNQDLQKLQEALLRHQNELQQKEQEKLAPIYARMQRIIATMAGDEDFTMIVDRNQGGIVFAKAHLDLTNDLIRRYNSGQGKGGGPAEAKAPAGGAKKAAAKK